VLIYTCSHITKYWKCNLTWQVLLILELRQKQKTFCMLAHLTRYSWRAAVPIHLLTLLRLHLMRLEYGTPKIPKPLLPLDFTVRSLLLACAPQFPPMCLCFVFLSADSFHPVFRPLPRPFPLDQMWLIPVIAAGWLKYHGGSPARRESVRLPVWPPLFCLYTDTMKIFNCLFCLLLSCRSASFPGYHLCEENREFVNPRPCRQIQSHFPRN